MIRVGWICTLGAMATPCESICFQHLREKNPFCARVREPVLALSRSTQNRSRSVLIEYAVLHDSLKSFSAQTEEEAFEYAIRQVMKNELRADDNEGRRDDV